MLMPPPVAQALLCHRTMRRVPSIPFALHFAPILLAALVAQASAATLTRGPYLQLLTSRSVTIVWNTEKH